MVIYVKNENHPYILVFDIEFDKKVLVQFSGLLFKNIGDGVYQLASTCTQYVKHKPSYPFSQYTHIKKNFLELNGVGIEDVVLTVKEDFIGNIDYKDILIVSHGLTNDKKILKENGIDLTECDGWCTFQNAKRILNRDKNLKLDDLATEAGFYLDGAHNAYHDAWATVSVLTFLKKLEGESK